MASTKGFKEAIKNIRKRMDAHYQGIAKETNLRLMIRSPIETGRFKSNWNVGINGSDSTTDEKRNHHHVFTTLARNERTIKSAKIGDSIHITNALPYAKKLEYGYSRQAPRGFLRITAQEIRAAQQR